MYIFFTSLQICFRSGAFKLLMYMCVAAVVLAIMVSGFSGRQPSTMLVDFGFSVLRISLCVSCLLWVQELIAKPLETKTIVQTLSYPAPRSAFLFAVFLAIVFVVFIAVAIFASIIGVLAANMFDYTQSTPVDFGVRYIAIWLFMVLDIAVVVGFCMLIAVVSNTPYLAIVVALGFYVAGHAVTHMADLLSIATYIDGRDQFQFAIKLVRYIIPDLSVFDVRHWALYSEDMLWKDVSLKLLTALCYLSVCLSLACVAFRHREIV